LILKEAVAKGCKVDGRENGQAKREGNKIALRNEAH
jgi:hypothetical protein